jgi:hypothetical protein
VEELDDRLIIGGANGVLYAASHASVSSTTIIDGGSVAFRPL